MKGVEAQLCYLDELLAHAVHDARTRSTVAATLRTHARQVIADRASSAYSLELALSDIDLVTALTEYELDDTEESVQALREQLRQFHAAILSGRSFGPISRAVPALAAYH